MVLIIGKTTKYGIDWVPFEIEPAVDKYQIPIIAVYVDYSVPIRPGCLAKLLTRRTNEANR